MIAMPWVLLPALHALMSITATVTEPATKKAVEKWAPPLTRVFERSDLLPFGCWNSFITSGSLLLNGLLGGLSGTSFGQQGLLPITPLLVPQSFGSLLGNGIFRERPLRCSWWCLRSLMLSLAKLVQLCT